MYLRWIFMLERLKLLLVTVFLLSIYGSAMAASEESGHDEKQDAFDVNEMIMHHISDSYNWHLYDKTSEDGTHEAVSIPLPVILFNDGNMDVFMSSEFHHGEEVVSKGDRHYVLYHNKIYTTSKSGTLKFDDDHHPLNDQPLDFSITRNVAGMLIGSSILLLLFISMGNYYRKDYKPKGLFSFLEPIVLFVQDEIVHPNIAHDKASKFMPFLLTLFFFILINNLLGLIPFFPGGSNVTGNIAVTFVLAFLTLIVVNINGNKNYWKHIFAMPGVPAAIKPVMAIVETIGIFSKPFALMVRLFANITAGHIIILSLVGLIFIFKTIMISPVSIVFVLFMDLMEILVAFLQAFIFTLLSALFIGMAVEEAHH